MKYGSSLRTRQFIVRLERGDELIDSLKSLFVRERAKSCCFTGHGFFSKCQFQAYSQDKHAIENQFACDSFVCVPTLSGNITTLGKEVIVTVFGVVSLNICGQQNTLSGIISSAKIFDLELHLSMFDDLSVIRSLDGSTGLIPITRITNEDYASNLRNASELSVDLPVINNGDSELPLISNFGNLSQNPAPEVIRRGDISQMGPQKAKAAVSSDNLKVIEDLDTGGVSQIKRRRRVAGANDNSKQTAQPVTANAPNSSDQNAVPKADNVGRRKANVVQISSEDRMHVIANEIPAIKDVPVLNNDSPINSYRHRTNTFKELSGIEEDDPANIAPGNWVIHPSLGCCTVVNILKNNCIQIRPDGGSVRDISLSYFSVTRVDDLHGIPCYRLDRI